VGDTFVTPGHCFSKTRIFCHWSIERMRWAGLRTTALGHGHVGDDAHDLACDVDAIGRFDMPACDHGLDKIGERDRRDDNRRAEDDPDCNPGEDRKTRSEQNPAPGPPPEMLRKLPPISLRLLPGRDIAMKRQRV
jgi:hypothetical protein